jgi:hypothetical protein
MIKHQNNTYLGVIQAIKRRNMFLSAKIIPTEYID